MCICGLLQSPLNSIMSFHSFSGLWIGTLMFMRKCKHAAQHGKCYAKMFFPKCANYACVSQATIFDILVITLFPSTSQEIMDMPLEVINPGIPTNSYVVVIFTI